MKTATNQKTHRNAEQIWHDDDGWWAILRTDLVIDGCKGVREDTWAKLRSRLGDAEQGAEY